MTGAPIGQPVRLERTGPYSDFSRDGRLAASGGGGVARIFNGLDATPIGEPLRHPRDVMGVAFHPNGQLLLTGCDDGIARFWDVATQKLVGQTDPYKGRIWPVAFNTDGTLFATANGVDTGRHWGELRVWNTETRQPVVPPLTHAAMISSAVFSRHKPWIVTACGDGLATVWNYETGEIARGPFRHPAGTAVAIFDPTERMLVTSSTDGHIRFWDLESQQQFGPDLVHGEWAIGLSITSDGKRLASGSLDGTVRIWEMPQPVAGTPDDIERRIQRATGLRLSDRGNLERLDASSWLKLAPNRDK
jgi:WD40 repeat protein